MKIAGRIRVELVATLLGMAIIGGCADPLPPVSRSLLKSPAVLRDVVAPCPDVAQRTTGGWCMDEFQRLDSILIAIYTGTPSCVTMQTSLRSWLYGGRIIRWDYAADSITGMVQRFLNEEWNDGGRLDWMRIDAIRGWQGSDWPATLRHEFGHVYANSRDQSLAIEYEGYCRDASSPSPPPEPAGPQVTLSGLPASLTLGHTVRAQSNCTGLAAWSALGSAVTVSSSGEVEGVSLGTGIVRVDCRGTWDQDTVEVVSPLCTLAQRLVRGVTAAPVLDLAESDCDGGGAPAPPTGGRGEDGQMDCYSIRAHLYEWWEGIGWIEVDSWVVGYVCYLNGMMT